ncbi:hypothetical protein ANCCAN_11118 [Ancylostoma caninum]|uniref:Secreted protein n=1 Tax=Ancylostoma caninum TaxID=29170 RepID=A0A368GIU1_ANCCA|nr:hypothetical protein ANCCAN_11118 [Ancylostoma caninum]
MAMVRYCLALTLYTYANLLIVETLLKHASGLLGCSVVNNSGNGGGHQPTGRSFTVDTNSSLKHGRIGSFFL